VWALLEEVLVVLLVNRDVLRPRARRQQPTAAAGGGATGKVGARLGTLMRQASSSARRCLHCECPPCQPAHWRSEPWLAHEQRAQRAAGLRGRPGRRRAGRPSPRAAGASGRLRQAATTGVSVPPPRAAPAGRTLFHFVGRHEQHRRRCRTVAPPQPPAQSVAEIYTPRRPSHTRTHAVVQRQKPRKSSPNN
jgi:hypothetical protein